MELYYISTIGYDCVAEKVNNQLMYVYYINEIVENPNEFLSTIEDLSSCERIEIEDFNKEILENKDCEILACRKDD